MLDWYRSIQVRIPSTFPPSHVYQSKHTFLTNAQSFLFPLFHVISLVNAKFFRPYRFNVPYRRLFNTYEEIVTRYGGKPHWAKAHSLGPEQLRDLYPRFDDYVKVLKDVDPNGLFRNEYMRRHIYGEVSPEVDGRVFKKNVGLATGPRHGL